LLLFEKLFAILLRFEEVIKALSIRGLFLNYSKK